MSGTHKYQDCGQAAHFICGDPVPNSEEAGLIVKHQNSLKTALNPYFPLTLNKRNPGRKTNQATMLVFQDKGKRIAVPVGSPAVYHISDDKTAVTSGCANELASSSIMLVEKSVQAYFPFRGILATFRTCLLPMFVKAKLKTQKNLFKESSRGQMFF